MSVETISDGDNAHISIIKIFLGVHLIEIDEKILLIISLFYKVLKLHQHRNFQKASLKYIQLNYGI